MAEPSESPKSPEKEVDDLTQLRYAVGNGYQSLKKAYAIIKKIEREQGLEQTKLISEPEQEKER